MAERQYLVVSDIPLGGVNAYTRGQTITEQAVNDNGWQDHVAAIGTKAAAEVQAELTGRDVSEFQSTSSRSTGSATTTEKG